MGFLARSPTRKKRTKSRWLKCVVGYCIGTITAVMVACYVAAWFGVDTIGILTAACGVFGGELLITCVIKVLEKPASAGEKTNDGKKETE